MQEIVFDIETYGDIKNQATMKVTVVSIYEYATDTYRSFSELELSSLWPILEKADRLIGYNSESFDLPILQRFYTGDLSRIRHLDILKVIRESTGKRFKLDDIAAATLQTKKSADGMQAMRWYEQGEIEKIKKYCEQDVKITKELYEFGKKNRMLYHSTLTGDLLPFPVSFDLPTESAVSGAISGGQGINLTLPF